MHGGVPGCMIEGNAAPTPIFDMPCGAESSPSPNSAQPLLWLARRRDFLPDKVSMEYSASWSGKLKASHDVTDLHKCTVVRTLGEAWIIIGSSKHRSGEYWGRSW